ncbi:hypothetical protein ACHAW5_006971 [Stephanodiscus triporus]|uniref:Uncharacterized protein n=1 Tax=Stephanodiscus triporus TaxID=2934178 RepID=A0ABD3PG49_9STRA
MDNNAPAASACGDTATEAGQLKSDPVAVSFTVGNTYRRLSPSEASYDKLTGRHLKIHDWTLYVDILPGQDPDIIERVTFDMRDNSFVTKAFTCHCPIRIRDSLGSAFIGQISGGNNQNNSQERQIGQPTSEGEKAEPSATTRPHPNQSRWRFSTRQQTYGPVDVQITIRGRGGCRCTVPYTIVLNPGGNECPDGSLPLFVEKRPHQQLKPLKMMDTAFSIEMYFGLDGSIPASSSLYETAKSVYARSKISIKVILENGRTEDFPNKQVSAASMPWLVTLAQPASTSTSHGGSKDIASNIISISSPDLAGGHGLNECYKIIEGLPSSCIISSTSVPSSSAHNTSLHVKIDMTTLSFQEIVKVCQNFVKYEEAMDSFVSWYRREDRSESCRSNKQAVEGNTNKERNVRISKCETMEDLINCMNPVVTHHYKLHLRRAVVGNTQGAANPKVAMEFRHHASSEDKTTVTHWIRFCAAFVRNSSRLRSPMALKGTTSLEEEFDLLFEYIIKDRALRNYYKEKRDAFTREDDLKCIREDDRKSSDEMSISDES